MTTRRIVVLALMTLCLGGLVLAQGEDLPLANWSAPPYWNPAVHPQKATEIPGGILARAQEMRAQVEALPSSPLPFVAVAPCRIVDTRVAVADGFHQPNFADDEARTFPFPSSTDCPGLPATAGAWSVNIQFRPISQLSYLTAFPTGTTMPAVSTLTAGPSAWVQNAAIVPAGTDGSIDVYCQFAGRVIIDVNGYYGPQSVVTSLNALAGNLTLAEGSNVGIYPSGSTITISATGGPGGDLPTGTMNQTLRHDGKGWSASSALTNNGINISLSNNLLLPDTASGGTGGVIFFAGSPFLHKFGVRNTFLGEDAGNFTMSGSYNTATGYGSLSSNSSGTFNTAVGDQSMASNGAGQRNTALGYRSMYLNTTGGGNTAIGSSALYSQSYSNDGVPWDSRNTAVGYHALYANQPTNANNGALNTAVGAYSLSVNSIGAGNTAVGEVSMTANTSGGANSALGDESMYSNTTGDGNTAIGYQSLFYNTSGGVNTGVGYWAGSDNTTGFYNTFVGGYSGATAGTFSNATAIGYNAQVNASNKVRIGNGSVTVIEGQVAWSYPSDVRLKDDVRDLDLGLDFVMRLRPVSFTMKGGDGKTDMGFLAQDLEALLGDGYNVLAIGPDPERTLSLRGTDLIAPLVKAIQELRAQLDARDARIAVLETRQASQNVAIEELSRQVQALVAAGEAPRTVETAGN